MSLGFCMQVFSDCGDQEIGKYQPAFNPDYINQPSLPWMILDASMQHKKHLPEEVEVPPGLVKQHSYSPGIHLEVYRGFIRFFWLYMYIYILSCITLFKLLVPSTRVEVKYASQHFSCFQLPFSWWVISSHVQTVRHHSPMLVPKAGSLEN